MLVSTKGILLHQVKYGETSLICRIYTEKLGLVSFIINGVRSIKSKGKAIILQPGNIIELEADYRENKSLQYVKEFKLAIIYAHLSSNIIKTSVCLFMLELLNNTIKEHETNEPLFDFLETSFLQLDQFDNEDASFPVWFMIQLSKQIGYEPGNEFDPEHSFFSLKEGLFHGSAHDEHSIGAPYSGYWFEIMQQDIPQSIYSKNSERRFLLEAVQTYFQYHVDGFKTLKSPSILHDVLS